MTLTANQLYFQSVRKRWSMYLYGTLSLLLTSSTEVLSPKFVQWSLDLVNVSNQIAPKIPGFLLGATRLESLRNTIIAFLVAAFLGFIGRVVWRQTLARRTHEAGRDLKTSFWDSLRFLPIRQFHKYPLGDLMNRATADWSASRFIHGFTIVVTYDLVFFTLMAVVAMAMIDFWLTVFCLAVFPFLPPFMTRLARKEYDQHIFAQEKLSDLSDLISQSLATIRLQRATGGERLWQAGLKKEAEDYASRRKEVIKTGWKIFPFGAIPTLFAYLILLVVGVSKISRGSLTIGEFVAFQSYVLLLQVPLFELHYCIEEWQRGFGSLKRIVEIFNLGEENTRAVQDKRVLVSSNLNDQKAFRKKEPVLAIKNFDFSFDKDNRKILDNVSLEMAAGDCIGISGTIGSGKTTLLRAIGGLLEIEKKKIFLVGDDLACLKKTVIANHVGMVTQEPFLFAGSIRSNLLLSGQFNDDQLWDVLEKVDFAKEIKAFSEGLDTWIGEWGITLSGGQKQRLALARTLLRPKPFLLLDDCLGAIDSITEEKILGKLAPVFKDMTILWVAHRPSTLSLCKEQYILENGHLSR